MRTHESPDKPASIEPRIAVVAIHGVGDHLPFATAREIGNLLAELEYDPSGTPRYAPFTEIFKRVNVRPVKTLDQSKEEPWRAGEHKGVKWGPLDAIARAAYDPATRSATLSAVDQIGLDHLFMYGQLAHYKGEKPEDTYELLRLEGRRVAPQAGSNSNRQSIAPDAAGEMAKELREHGIKTPQARAGEGSGKAPVAAFPGTNEKVVHIYEMYWADLSRLGTAFAQVFAELYQLLFHLGSVGANNVKAAAIHQDPPALSAWKMFDRAQTIAAATLAWPIPIFNLFLAALVPAVVVVSLMRRRLSAAEEFFALEAIIGILLAIGCGCVLLKRGFFSMLAYVAPLLSITAGGVLLAIFTYNAGYIPDREDTEAWCAIIISALAYGGVTLIVKAYSKRRPGSGRAALWMASAFVGSAALLGGWWTFPYGPRYFAILACLNFIEILVYLLIVSWFVLYLCYFLAHAAGWRAVHAIKPRRSDASEVGSKAATNYVRARRTRWTARLVIAISSSIFVVLTLGMDRSRQSSCSASAGAGERPAELSSRLPS